MSVPPPYKELSTTSLNSTFIKEERLRCYEDLKLPTCRVSRRVILRDKTRRGSLIEVPRNIWHYSVTTTYILILQNFKEFSLTNICTHVVVKVKVISRKNQYVLETRGSTRDLTTTRPGRNLRTPHKQSTCATSGPRNHPLEFGEDPRKTPSHDNSKNPSWKRKA